MLQSSLPTVVKDTGFTGRQPEHLPKLACRAVARSGQECMRARGPPSLRYGAVASLSAWLRAKAGSGGGSRAHGGRAYEARLNLILPAVKWWSRWVPPPYELACRASALLVCHDPILNVECRMKSAECGLQDARLGCTSGPFCVLHSSFYLQTRPPWCCPRQAEFWRLCCTGWCAAYLELRRQK